MPKRNDKRDTAKAEYVKRRRSGEKINLKEFAATLGVTYGTVRNWKKIDQWEDAIERKRGGQPGNKNSRGKKNAKGNPGGGVRICAAGGQAVQDERFCADDIPLYKERLVPESHSRRTAPARETQAGI